MYYNDLTINIISANRLIFYVSMTRNACIQQINHSCVSNERNSWIPWSKWLLWNNMVHITLMLCMSTQLGLLTRFLLLWFFSFLLKTLLC